MVTDEQRKKFGRVNAGYSPITTPKRTLRPTNGCMWLDGYLYLYDLPFPLLNSKKRELMNKGYNSKRIKIGYNKK